MDNTDKVQPVDNTKPAVAKARVLLAEDDEISKILLVNILRKVDCEIITARSGQEAVEKYREQAIDLVLMDVSMPVMDGFEAASLIREMEGDAGHTPIMALTAHAYQEIEKRYHNAGMDDFLTKPINIKEFLQKVKALLPTATQSD